MSRRASRPARARYRCARIQRSARQAIRRELGAGGADTGREPGEQLMGNGGLPVQVQAGPVIGKTAGPGRSAASDEPGCGRPDASNERGTPRRRGVRDEEVPRVTAADRHGPHLRRRSLPENLTGRRGAALVPPILAAGLNAAAAAGLAYIAGFHAVHTALTRIQWPWLCAVPAAFGMSAVGYYFAYRGSTPRVAMS